LIPYLPAVYYLIYKVNMKVYLGMIYDRKIDDEA